MDTFPSITLSIIVITGSYLLGSIPVGLLLVRATMGEDVREIGSGRTGGTNTLRAAGPWVGLLTALADAVKGLLAVWLARAVVGRPVVEALAGLSAVLGHNHSIFIGFKGGAGTMTTAGGATGLWPWNIAIFVCTGVPMVIATRQASVGSITIALVTPIVFAVRAWQGHAPWAYLIHGLGTAVLILWALRPNIQRLLKGRERKVTFRRKV